MQRESISIGYTTGGEGKKKTKQSGFDICKLRQKHKCFKQNIAKKNQKFYDMLLELNTILSNEDKIQEVLIQF